MSNQSLSHIDRNAEYQQMDESYRVLLKVLRKAGRLDLMNRVHKVMDHSSSDHRLVRCNKMLLGMIKEYSNGTKAGDRSDSGAIRGA